MRHGDIVVLALFRSVKASVSSSVLCHIWTPERVCDTLAFNLVIIICVLPTRGPIENSSFEDKSWRRKGL